MKIDNNDMRKIDNGTNMRCMQKNIIVENKKSQNTGNQNKYINFVSINEKKI